MARIFTNPKTEEWMSASDLMTDKTFPMGNYRKILEKLTEMLPVMPKSIQTRKTSFGTDVICLHRDSREKFLSKIGFIEYQPKTSEWQSAFDFIRSGGYSCIKSFTTAVVKKPLFPCPFSVNKTTSTPFRFCDKSCKVFIFT